MCEDQKALMDEAQQAAERHDYGRSDRPRHYRLGQDQDRDQGYAGRLCVEKDKATSDDHCRLLWKCKRMELKTSIEELAAILWRSEQ